MSNRNKTVHKKRKKKSNGFAIIAFAVLTFFAVRGMAGLLKDTFEKQPRVTPTPQITIQPTATPRSAPIKPEKNEYTTLVNRANPLTDDFDVETRKVTYNGQTVEKYFDVRVADKLEAMLNDAAKRGYPMYLVSTYRTIEYQKGLFNRKVQQYINSGYTQAAAKEEAAKWVAIPGTSEHNLGLVADIVSSTWYNSNSDLTHDFEKTEHFTWLIENCADYGFILRYPKGKDSVTGIVYEPWHYRYVGREVAKYIMENNLTLEEFWEE